MGKMDTTTLVLIGVGGYLAYAYMQKLWPFNVTVVAAAPIQPPPSTVPVLNAAALAAQAQKNTSTIVPPAPTPTTQPPTVGTQPIPAPPIVVTPPAPPIQTTMQQMAALAAGQPLSMDQWCYYYTQVSGNQCPVDPGSIDPGVYHDAGVQLSDGSPGDRSTPTSIDTWYAIMQNQVAGFNLSGLGMFVPALAGSRVGSPWLL
jgi:hypothetical protein